MLELDEPSIRYFTDFNNYLKLNDEDEAPLLLLARILHPLVLMRAKVMFQNDELCGDSQNKFYELSQAKQMLDVATDDAFVAGNMRRVQCIMTCTEYWIYKYFVQPYTTLEKRKQNRDAESNAARKSCTCAIL